MTNDVDSSPRQFTEEEWQAYWADKTVFEKLSAINAFRDRRFPPEKQVMLEIMTQINPVDLEFRNVGVLEHEKENEKMLFTSGSNRHQVEEHQRSPT